MYINTCIYIQIYIHTHILYIHILYVHTHICVQIYVCLRAGDQSTFACFEREEVEYMLIILCCSLLLVCCLFWSFLFIYYMHIHWRCASWWWFGNPFRASFKSSVRKSGQWGHVWVRTCSCLRTVFCLFYGTNIYFVSISVSISCPSKHWIQSKSSDRIFSCLHDELDFIHAIFLFFCIPFV